MMEKLSFLHLDSFNQNPSTLVKNNDISLHYLQYLYYCIRQSVHFRNIGLFSIVEIVGGNDPKT
jgi:hypothetical protein